MGRVEVILYVLTLHRCHCHMCAPVHLRWHGRVCVHHHTSGILLGVRCPAPADSLVCVVLGVSPCVSACLSPMATVWLGTRGDSQVYLGR